MLSVAAVGRQGEWCRTELGVSNLVLTDQLACSRSAPAAAELPGWKQLPVQPSSAAGGTRRRPCSCEQEVSRAMAGGERDYGLTEEQKAVKAKYPPVTKKYECE